MLNFRCHLAVELLLPFQKNIFLLSYGGPSGPRENQSSPFWKPGTWFFSDFLTPSKKKKYGQPFAGHCQQANKGKVEEGGGGSLLVSKGHFWSLFDEMPFTFGLGPGFLQAFMDNRSGAKIDGCIPTRKNTFKMSLRIDFFIFEFSMRLAVKSIS